MGLDFRVAGLELPREVRPSWSYSGFNEFRDRILRGFGTSGYELYSQVENRIRVTAPQPKEGPWSRVPADLYPLINHSDCDGVLTPAECGRVWKPLGEIVMAWTDEGEAWYHRRMGWRLVFLMGISHTEGRNLEFC